MNEAQRGKVLEKLRAKREAANRTREIQERLDFLLTTPPVIEYTSLMAELEACKKTVSEDNPAKVDKCKHSVVLFDKYQKSNDWVCPVEEPDPYTEITTYYCLDCGAKIGTPVKPRDLVTFAKDKEIIDDGEQNLTPEQMDTLLNYYRSLLENHSAKDTIEIFKRTYRENLSSKHMNYLSLGKNKT